MRPLCSCGGLRRMYLADDGSVDQRVTMFDEEVDLASQGRHSS